MGEFKREDRYIVFKVKDFLEVATHNEREAVEKLGEAIDYSRKAWGKLPLKCVVVESDWPEYEAVWKMIEARMSDATPPTEQTGRVDEIAFKADLFRALYDGFGFISPKGCDTITDTAFEILKSKGYLSASAVSLPSRGEVMQAIEQSRSEAGWSLIHQTDAIMALLTDRLGKPVEVER